MKLRGRPIYFLMVSILIGAGAYATRPILLRADAAEPAFPPADREYILRTGYAREGELQVRGGTTARYVFVRADRYDPASDAADSAAEDSGIVVGFVGPGSLDEPVRLEAGAPLTVRLSVNAAAPDRALYEVPVSLYVLDSEDDYVGDARRVARTNLRIQFTPNKPQINVRKITEDKATLAQTYEITNTGDDIGDLTVRGVGLFGSMVRFEPRLENVYLEQGARLRFRLIPDLYPGIRDLGGEIEFAVPRPQEDVENSEETQNAGDVMQRELPRARGEGGFVAWGANWVQRKAISYPGKMAPKALIGFARGAGDGAREPRYRDEDGGSGCTNEGRQKRRPGRQPRRPPDDDQDPFWNKKSMANLYGSNMGRSIGYGKVASKASGLGFLGGPLTYFNAITDSIADRIGQDPPDADFRSIAYPQFREPPRLTAGTGKLKNAAEAYVRNAMLLEDLSIAIMATYDKLGGARAARDDEWIEKQAAAARLYAFMLMQRTVHHAGLTRELGALVEERLREAYPDGLPVELAEEMQNEIRARGFSESERAELRRYGLSDEHRIEELRQAVLAAAPEDIVRTNFDELATILYAGDGEAPADLARVFELAAYDVDLSLATAASLTVNFSLEEDHCPIAPHTTVVSLNGETAAQYQNFVPEGNFYVTVDPKKIRTLGGAPGGNEIGIESFGLNNGHFIRSSNVTLNVRLRSFAAVVFANTQQEADRTVAGSGLVNADRPDAAIFVDRDSDPVSRERGARFGRASRARGTTTHSIVVRNLGPARTGEISVHLYANDPRTTRSPRDRIRPERVPPLDPEGAHRLVITVPESMLSDRKRYYVMVRDRGSDYDPTNNVMMFSPPADCRPPEDD